MSPGSATRAYSYSPDMSEDVRRAAVGCPVVAVDRPVDGVAVVTLNRPGSLNAIDVALIDGMMTAFTELAGDDGVTVVILTGAGRGFCSGADLAALSAEIGADGAGLRSMSVVEWMRGVAQPVLALNRLPQLTIAAVDGPAVGAGWGLAMGCDIRIAGPSASFCATFVRMGLGPDYGLSRTLSDAVGRARALELLATGRTVDSTEAQQLGLVLTVADNPLDAATELAATIATVPGRTIRALKSALGRSSNADIATVVNEIEATAQAELFTHPDFLAGAADWFSRHGAADATD
jgi:enoyl-CoA hydratase/carnithine racemase